MHLLNNLQKKDVIQLYEENAKIRLLELLEKQKKIEGKSGMVEDVEIPDVTLQGNTVTMDED